jgi:hypothetical protein
MHISRTTLVLLASLASTIAVGAMVAQPLSSAVAASYNSEKFDKRTRDVHV